MSSREVFSNDNKKRRVEPHPRNRMTRLRLLTSDVEVAQPGAICNSNSDSDLYSHLSLSLSLSVSLYLCRSLPRPPPLPQTGSLPLPSRTSRTKATSTTLSAVVPWESPANAPSAPLAASRGVIYTPESSAPRHRRVYRMAFSSFWRLLRFCLPLAPSLLRPLHKLDVIYERQLYWSSATCAFSKFRGCWKSNTDGFGR